MYLIDDLKHLEAAAYGVQRHTEEGNALVARSDKMSELGELRLATRLWFKALAEFFVAETFEDEFQATLRRYA